MMGDTVCEISSGQYWLNWFCPDEHFIYVEILVRMSLVQRPFLPYCFLSLILYLQSVVNLTYSKVLICFDCTSGCLQALSSCSEGL